MTGAVIEHTRRGDGINTYTGGTFYPLDPKAEEVRILDIASGLSKTTRFNGQCRQFYSVAQHSIHVAELLPEELKLWGLLHDAPEAYLGDIVRPLKRQPEWTPMRQYEDRLMEVIAERFGLEWPMPAEVKHADDILVKAEKRVLLPGSPDWPGWEGVPDVEINFHLPEHYPATMHGFQSALMIANAKLAHDLAIELRDDSERMRRLNPNHTPAGKEMR